MQKSAQVLVGGAALVLAACGSETSGEFTTEDGNNAEYTIDKATGETTMTVEGPDGTATLRSGAGVPVNLPDGFSLYAGSTVVTNTIVQQADGQGTMVMFEADGDSETIGKHYRQQATAAGFDIEIDINANGTRIIGGERKADGATVSITVNPGDGDVATGQIIIGTNKG